MNQLNVLKEQALSYQPMPFFDDLKEHLFSLEAKVKYKLDLNLYCIRRPQQTCFIRVTNPNLLAWGIEQGDILIVEYNQELNQGDLVVIKQNDQFEIYELFSIQTNEYVFFPLDSKQKSLKIQNWQQLPIVGTVTNTIHQFKPKNTIRLAA